MRPKITSAQGHGLVAIPGEKTDACVGAVVVTLTLKFAAVLALTDSVAGTEQVALVGAPAQLSEVVPSIPPPPIESVYVALEPAVTFAELELPDATVSASIGLPPVPVSVTLCGLLVAPSVRVSVPVRPPLAVGVKVTLTVQLALALRDVPQVLDSAKSPLVCTRVMPAGSGPGLVTVTICAVLVVPTAWFPNEMFCGAIVSVTVTP